MMFTKTAPQYAQHADGFSVFVADREHAAYKDQSIEARIESDFLCGVVPLYIKTLNIKVVNETKKTQAKDDLIISRIQEGLSFLGVKSELIY